MTMLVRATGGCALLSWTAGMGIPRGSKFGVVHRRQTYRFFWDGMGEGCEQKALRQALPARSVRVVWSGRASWVRSAGSRMLIDDWLGARVIGVGRRVCALATQWREFVSTWH